MSNIAADKGVITAMVVSATIVVASRWAQKKPLDARMGLGAVFATVALSAITSYAPVLGKGLTAVVLVTTLIVDGPPVFSAVINVQPTPLSANTKLTPK